MQYIHQRPLRQYHYGPSGLASTIIFNAPEGLPGKPLLRNVWRSGSEWERVVDAWRTSGPSMEGTGVHFNLSQRRQLHQRPYCISRPRRVAFHSRRILRPRHRSPSPCMVPTKDPNLDKICNLVGLLAMYKAVRLFLEALKTEPTSIRT